MPLVIGHAPIQIGGSSFIKPQVLLRFDGFLELLLRFLMRGRELAKSQCALEAIFVGSARARAPPRPDRQTLVCRRELLVLAR